MSFDSINTTENRSFTRSYYLQFFVIKMIYRRMCQKETTIIHHKKKVLKGRRANGGYSTGVPPLPIPNREVKPRSADGTAFVGE